ncbi:uncharacterized protein L201_006682 [Kwoniella dendrophila CBS 6074]|uniref:Proteasome assembly chaperone 3 n=1 Tax=Kwoniella dendrophila CBS 6074 TaxID=1295534 RepID=A0AAX4K288_9TREE
MSSLLEESHEVQPTASSSTFNPSPIQSYQWRKSICNVDTELLIQTFDDRILVIVTQNGKVGCLTQASLPAHIPLLPPPQPSSTNGHSDNLHILEILPIPPPSIKLTNLLGKSPNETLYDLYINQISTLIFWALEISSQPRRNVVVGLSLKKRESLSSHTIDEEDEGDILDDYERERYAGIMELVSQWSGPEE